MTRWIAHLKAQAYFLGLGLVNGLHGCLPVSYTHLTLPTIYSV